MVEQGAEEYPVSVMFLAFTGWCTSLRVNFNHKTPSQEQRAGRKPEVLPVFEEGVDSSGT